MKKLIWIASLVTSLFLSPIVLADSWQCGDRIKNLVASLDLGKEQKDKITPIVDQFKSSLKENWSQLKDIKTQLHQQILSANMDKSTVDDLINKKAQILGNIMKAKATAVNQIFVILDEKQRVKLQDKMKKAEAKMEEKWSECKDQMSSDKKSNDED